MTNSRIRVNVCKRVGGWVCTLSHIGHVHINIFTHVSYMCLGWGGHEFQENPESGWRLYPSPPRLPHAPHSLSDSQTDSDSASTALPHTAAYCNTLQHTATHCNTLQHTATHCNTLQHTATLWHSLQTQHSH